jgi:hypothetical protein
MSSEDPRVSSAADNFFQFHDEIATIEVEKMHWYLLLAG